MALVLGSGRPLLDDPSLLPTYRAPRQRAPAAAARQPRRRRRSAAPAAADRAERLVELLGADGLSIHLNAVQEAVQPEGEPRVRRRARRHRGDRRAARAAARSSSRRSASGWTPRTSARSPATGVAAVDVAGAGGTNWALIEGRRDPRAGAVAAAFGDWGVPTVDALAGALPRRAAR